MVQEVYPNISVAMATYNGQKYLKQQLDSLLEQSHEPCEVIIGDDGSEDSTLKMLHSFSEEARFPVVIIKNKVNLGYAANFFNVASHCKGEWVAFCDQDDVWFKDKLKNAACAIKENPDLNLILQNSYICDEYLNRWREFPGKLPGKVYDRFENPAYWVWPGFLQTVRMSLLSKLDIDTRPLDPYTIHEKVSHDRWVCMVANTLGDICVLSEPAALYRRHEEAFSGQCEQVSFAQAFLNAKEVGQDRYTFMAELSEQYARYFFGSDDVGINEGAAMYHRLASLFLMRALIYSEASFLEKTLSYIKLWFDGFYFGKVFFRAGGRAAIKDMLVLLGLLKAS